MPENFYSGKRIFVTGHTGFKGSWLSVWLTESGAEVCGYSLEPATKPSMFTSLKLDEKIKKSVFGNILDSEKLSKTISDFKPEIIFHLAAQPLVRLSYKEPKLTYETNVIGTLNVLEAARECKSVKAFINITTDKCYENRETSEGYREDDPMGGYDLYSSSKGCVEILSASYRNSFLGGSDVYYLATARAGNAIGGGDWSEDRLIPDCIRAVNESGKIKLRNPHAIRPWQHVCEPLSGYLLLGEKLYKSGEEYSQGFNFGPKSNSILTAEDVAERICKAYGRGEVLTGEKSTLHEASLLLLNTEKAERVLGWTPTFSADEAVCQTVRWYKNFYESETNMYNFTVGQIEYFKESAKWNKSYATK